MDYNKIKIKEEMTEKGFYHKQAAYKLHRLLFSLALYPDWKLACVFADMVNYRGFVEYWLEPDIAKELMLDVKRRKNEEFMSSDIIEVMEQAYTRLQNGENYLIEEEKDEDEEVMEELATSPSPIVNENIVFELMGVNEGMNYEFVIKNADMLMDMERLQRRSPMINEGIYWIAAYDLIPIKSTLRPFVLLVKVAEDYKTLESLCGIWMLEYMRRFVNKVVPIPYRATIDDLRFIEVETTEAKGHFKKKFKGFKRLYPVKESYELL